MVERAKRFDEPNGTVTGKHTGRRYARLSINRLPRRVAIAGTTTHHLDIATVSRRGQPLTIVGTRQAKRERKAL